MTQANSSLSEFFSLSAEAARVDEGLELPIEPAFEAVLNHVLAHPSDRSAFVQAFLEVMLEPTNAPPDLVEFCMHELRWEELRNAFSSWLAKETDGRVRHVLKGIISSFDPDWDGAQLYNRFTKSDNR